MSVRVYFVSGQQPIDYAEATVEWGNRSSNLRNGSLTVKEYGVYIKEDGRELLIPWSAVTAVELKRSV